MTPDISIGKLVVNQTRSRSTALWWIRDDGIIKVSSIKDATDSVIHELKSRGIRIPPDMPTIIFVMDVLGWIGVETQGDYIAVKIYKNKVSRSAYASLQLFLKHNNYRTYAITILYPGNTRNLEYSNGSADLLLQEVADNLIPQVMPPAIIEAKKRVANTLMQANTYGRRGAGCIILAKTTNRILLPFRSDEVPSGNCWGTWGGSLEENEHPVAGAKRELEEESGYSGPMNLKLLYVYRSPNSSFSYFNYLAEVQDEFTPTLNWETAKADWFEYDNWPKPQHIGLSQLLTDDYSLTAIENAIRRTS